MKKLISLIMAVILVITTFSISITSYADSLPYLDANGDMVRLCDGEWLTFETSYEDILKTVKNALMNREKSVSIRYACTKNTNADLCFDYTDNHAEKDAYCKKFINKLYHNVFLDDDPSNPFDGEYLYYSITGNFGYTANARPNNKDIINGEKYTNYELTLYDINYYTTLAQENEIKDFVNTFNTKFATASHTDYENVKTIYDFVVRNTEYDDVAFKGENVSQTRLNIAHSAYGAIKGALLDSNGKQTKDYNWDIQNFIFDVNIISTANQGLAVCEGITKLFYLLCESNGIKCKIIDGDYTENSGKDSDPHEWAEVYLDDGVKQDGARWYLVDPTFAIQRSIKEVHFNNYDYFLRGTASDVFHYKNHQTAYPFKEYDITSNDAVRSSLYDLYSKEYLASAEDYEFSPPDFSNVIDAEAMILIERSYTFNNEKKGAYILTNSTETKRIEFDEKGNITINEDVEGFVYNGLENEFKAWMPYIVGIEAEITGDMKNVGPCSFELKGKNDTKYTYNFNIIPNDMTAQFDHGSFSGGNYSEDSEVEWQAGYNGSTITPEINIVDGYHNTLIKDRDYKINIYSDEARENETDIRDIGTYYIDINYINNYTGKFTIVFEVGKINLKNMNDYTYHFNYYPKKMLASKGISTPADEFIQATAKGLTIGDYKIKPNIDFSTASTGSLEYGATGTITLTGLKSSELVEAGSKKTYSYTVSKQYDISSLDKSWAQTTPFYHTGKEIKPTKFSQLEKYFELGVDYKITGYKNNIKNGKASVFIQGINGCTGKAEMYFQIADNPNKPNISKAKVSYSNKSNTFKYTLKIGSKTLVKNKDYKESVSVKSGKGVITCTGIGSYGGTLKLNLPAAVIPPSGSGNYIKAGSTYTYTGKAIKPSVKLYNSSKKLVNNFFISSIGYSSNTNVGLGKITVKTKTGKTATKTFKINPVKTSISSLSAGSKRFKVKWSKKTKQTSGYQIQYSTSSKFSKPATITVSKNTTTSYTKKGLKAKKKYYVRIRTFKKVGSKKYYSSWSKAKSVTTKK